MNTERSKNAATEGELAHHGLSENGGQHEPEHQPGRHGHHANEHEPRTHSERRGLMMRISMTIVVLGVLVIGAHGQELKSLLNEYRPGDPIRLTLTFDGPVDLTSAGVSFSLVKVREESQRLWTANFNVNELKNFGQTNTKSTPRPPHMRRAVCTA